MKSNIIKFTGLLALVIAVFTGCAKAEKEPEEENPTNPITTPAKEFIWSIDGNTTVTADDSYFVPSFDNIIASKSTSTVDVILNDLNKGSHTISPSNGVTLDYTAGSITYSAKSGTFIITENTGSLIAGTFTCSFPPGSAFNTIKGEFSNVPKK